MQTKLALLCLSLVGCETLPADNAKCDTFAFLSSFKPTSGVVIECRRVYSPTESESQSFNEYTDGRTTVTYWANSYPIRIEGAAPACLREEYRETIPRPPMLASECMQTPLVVTP